MSRSALQFIAYLTFIVSAFSPSVIAQNLLTNNADFEANTEYYTPGWGYPEGSPDALPGWVITLDLSGDGYAGADTNQSPQDLQGSHFGYIYSGTGSSGILETAPDSRAPVEAGVTYTVWFLARGDASWSEASATVSLVWHPNRNNGATVGDPTNLDLTLPPPLSTDDPMQTFYISAAAPHGAHYAGVRITRPPYDYTPIILDDFVIMVEPTVVSLSIKKKGQKAEISWLRSLKHHLEMNTDLTLSNGWSAVNEPTKGIGPKNYLDFTLAEPPRFFRLTKSN
jgi:hypothetical protein